MSASPIVRCGRVVVKSEVKERLLQAQERGEGAFVAGGKGMRRSEEARVSEEAVKRKGGGAGPRELGTSQG